MQNEKEELRRLACDIPVSLYNMWKEYVPYGMGRAVLQQVLGGFLTSVKEGKIVINARKIIELNKGEGNEVEK